MEFGTAKGLEFLLIFGVILGGCLYQLHAVKRDARRSAERHAVAERRDRDAAPEATRTPR